MADESKTASASAGPPVEATLQDPLPESGFFYRRITTWAVSLLILGMLWFIVVSLRHLAAPDGLVTVAKWLIVLLGLSQTYYLIAPSAEHIVKMIQTVGAWKSGIVTRSVATVTGKGGQTAQSSTSAGREPNGPPVDDDIPDYAR